MYSPFTYSTVNNSQFILQEITGIIYWLQQLHCTWTYRDRIFFLCLLSSISLQETWSWWKPSHLCTRKRVCMCFLFVLSLSPTWAVTFFCPWIFQSPWKVSNVNVSTVYQWCNCPYTFRTPFFSCSWEERLSWATWDSNHTTCSNAPQQVHLHSLVIANFLEVICNDEAFGFGWLVLAFLYYFNAITVYLMSAHGV